MNSLILVGGKQKITSKVLPEWLKFEKGLILEIDPVAGKVLRRLEYESPPEARPDIDYSVIFKAASLHGNTLFACTQTEILTFNMETLKQEQYFSHPWFNDVHFVTWHPANGNIVVVNTGLDSILEFDNNFNLIEEKSVLGKDTWERFDKSIDYRKVLSTKPHQAHPNYAFFLKDEMYVTRFEQRDAILLKDTSVKYNIEIEKPHDGIVFGDEVFFTTVNGNILVFNQGEATPKAIYDLNKMDKRLKTLGWCRGLHVIDERKVIVGFSRLRHTKFEANLDWLKGLKKNIGLLSTLPCRIACYDLENKNLVWEFELEPHDMSAVFSIHSVG
jgi:hypothetical protein